MRNVLLGILLFALPALARSQSPGALLGPGLGFVLDSKLGSVRALHGISGSATVGEPIDAGVQLTNVISLPDQRNVLGVPESGPFLLAIDMGMNPPYIRPISGASGITEITLSPNGKTAALANRAGQLVEVLTGLTGNPAVTLEISTAPVRSPLNRVVVNDAGNLLLMTFLENDREAIYRWSELEGFRFLSSVVRVGALGFVGASDAVYADSGTDEVFLASDVRNGSVTQFLAGPSDGVSGPAGMGASRNGGFFLANSATGTVLTFAANHSIVRTQQCDCDVSGMSPLSAGLFRLTDKLTQTIYLLDDTGVEPRLVFIPALQ